MTKTLRKNWLIVENDDQGMKYIIIIIGKNGPF
jgi:hypothetical protein